MLQRFYILEADPVVQMDLELMLSSAFPDASVHLEERIKAGASIFVEAGKDCAIFLRSSVAEAVGELIDALTTATERGALVYLLGDPIPVPFDGRFIELPFSNESILDRLKLDTQ